MSTLRTYNLQNPDSASVNIELTSDGGAVAAGILTATTLNATTISGVSTIGVTTATVTTLTVNGNAYPSAGPLSNRNLIINGAMQVAQRGTSTTSAGYLLDRFLYSASGATGTYSQESFTIGQTDVPGADKYLKLDITTGDNNSGIYHKIEAKNAFGAIGKKVTLSYYAKGTSPTDGLQVGILWYDGSTSSSKASTTITLTSSWVKYTHTFDVPSISGLTLTNASAYLEVHWQQASTDTGTAAYQLQMAQVQLEVGSVATPFEHRSYGEELALCKRYYQRMGDTNTNELTLGGYAINNVNIFHSIQLPVEMRTIPTSTQVGTFYAVSTGQPTSLPGHRGRKGFGVAHVTTGDGWFLLASSASAYFVLDAEL